MVIVPMPEGIKKRPEGGMFLPFGEWGGIHDALLQVLFEEAVFPNGNRMHTFEFSDDGSRTESIEHGAY